MLARPIRSSEGSGMLVGDPLGEGSNASFTDSELWEAEDSFLRMRGNSPFFIKKICPGLIRKFPPNLGQVEFTVVTGEL